MTLSRLAVTPLLRPPALSWLSLVWTWTLLLAYAHPPAVDWPEHSAVAGILVALWRRDPCVSTYYAVNLQPNPSVPCF